MSTIRVLVVDDDPWTQRMVSAVLGHAGHHVDVASDGWEALIRVGRSTPDLVITEVRLPTTDGWSFVETLRSRRETRDTPVIFLSTFPADRRRGGAYRPDLDELLAKPFRLEQLEAVVRRVLTRGQAEEVTEITLLPPSPPPLPEPEREKGSLRAVLTGSLDEFGVSSVLIVLELERKSGVLVLSRPTATGRIYLREGRVIRAEMDGSDARGALVVYQLLTWTEGRFEFSVGDTAGADEIGSSTSFLLMEGARLQDEESHTRGGNN